MVFPLWQLGVEMQEYNNSPKKFRKTTKINRQEKIGVFSSGVFLFLGLGISIFFLIVFISNNVVVGFVFGGFIIAVLLVAGGSDPYKFIRSLINTTKKPKWTWGRYPARSLLLSQKLSEGVSFRTKVKSQK